MFGLRVLGGLMAASITMLAVTAPSAKTMKFRLVDRSVRRTSGFFLLI